MLKVIKHCMANLTNFAGREPRTTFWFFVLFLIIAQVVFPFGSDGSTKAAGNDIHKASEI